MAVIVVVTVLMPVRADLLHAHDTAVCDLALHVLELDRRVLDMELRAEPAVYFFKNACAL